MACTASYTVVIIPLENSPWSSDALRFFLWLKRLKGLEQEKDCLCNGLSVLDRARFWYCQQIADLKERQQCISTEDTDDIVGDFFLKSRIQEVNHCLEDLMSDSVSHKQPDCHQQVFNFLKEQNRLLRQEVNEKSQRISHLEGERRDLLKQLDDLRAVSPAHRGRTIN
ncbi:suppressor APC domain-containing protein 2 isoform X1 [Acipenser ruthenus]|uniref:suppressor APC domain-containing protein 2 isoform X1 n=1 Tax=Acipenser ruthenus TaxID=7906 RepID=UPI00274032AA|nr:suppressor APC domain-containing protein 2 isoform X1 [Acipenser ruthenus]